MERAVPVNPVSAIDVPASWQPGQVEAGNPGGPLTSADTRPRDSCGELSFEGFEEARVAVTAMMRRVRRATASGSPLAEVEEAVHEELLTVGAAVVQGELNAISAAEVRRHDVSGPEGAPRPWVDPGRTRTLTTLFGDVTFTRLAYRGPGLPDVFPADETLDLPAGPSYSRTLELRASYLEALLAYRQVRDLLEWETGVTIHTRQLREIAARVAADAATFAQTRTVPGPVEVPGPDGVPGSGEVPGPDGVDDAAGPAGVDAAGGVDGSVEGGGGGCLDGRVLVVTFDGKGVIMRRESLRSGEGRVPGALALGAGLPGQEQSGYRRGRKRLAELSCVYDVHPQPRTVQDVIQVLAGRFADPQAGPARRPAGAPRPRARARWLQASLTATIDQVVADGFAQADRRDPTHRWGWLALVDGNKSQIDAITAQAAARGVHVPILIDLLHVLGYLGDAANAARHARARKAHRFQQAQAKALRV